ncbi:hypothetical protein ACFFIX_13535 [Metabacillus herbersteinensis]|uniref:N-acetyltransferase domain-containing protein n=1 Tax=Metabacillus herbersteinensis TaxID=283816 RepID=A0ABV6GG71_9BACI
MFYQLKIAEENDGNKLTEFVEKAGVSSEGITSMLDYFVMMEDGENEVVACIGVEPVGEDGILRSLVISDKLKQAHVLTLFQSVQTLSQQKNMNNLYLVTNKKASVDFMLLMGFDVVELNDVPGHLSTSEHIKNSLLSPDTTVMVKNN